MGDTGVGKQIGYILEGDGFAICGGCEVKEGEFWLKRKCFVGDWMIKRGSLNV
jgi:hypothetical protein